MASNFGSVRDINMKFGRLTSNRILLKVTKFRSPTGYRKKVILEKLTGGGTMCPPVEIGLSLVSNKVYFLLNSCATIVAQLLSNSCVMLRANVAEI